MEVGTDFGTLDREISLGCRLMKPITCCGVRNVACDMPGKIHPLFRTRGFKYQATISPTSERGITRKTEDMIPIVLTELEGIDQDTMGLADT